MKIISAKEQIKELVETIALLDNQVKYWNESYNTLREDNNKLKEDNRILYAKSLGLDL